MLTLSLLTIAMPAVSGNSHASFTRCVATIGGQTGWTPAARKVIQAGQAVFEKALSPLVNDALRDPGLTSDRRQIHERRNRQDYR